MGRDTPSTFPTPYPFSTPMAPSLSGPPQLLKAGAAPITNLQNAFFMGCVCTVVGLVGHSVDFVNRIALQLGLGLVCHIYPHSLIRQP